MYKARGCVVMQGMAEFWKGGEREVGILKGKGCREKVKMWRQYRRYKGGVS